MAQTVIARESEAASSDVGADGLEVDSSIIVATALILAATVRDQVKVIEVWLEYECDETQTLLLEYSSDGGQNWSALGASFAVSATTRPTLLIVTATVAAPQLQIRLRSTTLGMFRLTAMIPRIVQERRAYPATARL